MNILDLWHTNADLIEAAGGMALGWYGKRTAIRAAERRDQLHAGDQALQLNATLSVREQLLSKQLEGQQRAYWVLIDGVQDVYAEAIAVRLIVHDLDAAAGRPLRQFRPLPPYPFPAQAEQPVAGATAAATAEPRAENTHV